MYTTHEIWTDLRNCYHQGDQTITQYYTKLKKLCQELDNFRPFITCSCNPKYFCDLLPTFKSYCESDHVIRFLKGVNEQYAHVQSQIMLIHLLPPLNKYFYLLIQQEK